MKKKSKKIFIKTKSIPELEKEFGKNWRLVVGWNMDGHMDHLAGEMLKCDNTESWSGVYYFDKKLIPHGGFLNHHIER